MRASISKELQVGFDRPTKPTHVSSFAFGVLSLSKVIGSNSVGAQRVGQASNAYKILPLLPLFDLIVDFLRLGHLFRNSF